jgi:hypothetical protein
MKLAPGCSTWVPSTVERAGYLLRGHRIIGFERYLLRQILTSCQSFTSGTLFG